MKIIYERHHLILDQCEVVHSAVVDLDPVLLSVAENGLRNTFSKDLATITKSLLWTLLSNLNSMG